MLVDGLLFKANTFMPARHFNIISEPSDVRPVPLHNYVSLRARLIPEIAAQRHQCITSNVSSFLKTEPRTAPRE